MTMTMTMAVRVGYDHGFVRVLSPAAAQDADYYELDESEVEGGARMWRKCILAIEGNNGRLAKSKPCVIQAFVWALGVCRKWGKVL